jgi:hypothetical protein
MKHLTWFPLASLAVMLSISLQVKADIRMTAGKMKTAADSIALTFAGDAKLAVVTCSDIDTTGKSRVWSYVYFSLDSSKEYTFIAQNDTITFGTSSGIRVGVGVLNVQWIDSDSALSIAERARGANIRARFPSCTIMASLIRPVVPSALSYWRIDYKCSDSTRTVVINAATGEITSVKREAGQLLPTEPWLRQNYPNPFNPSTTIEFILPSASTASIKVFNVLGQKVATLVNEHLSAGTHKIQWHAQAIESGTYFCRLVTSGHSETRKLILQK